MIKKTVETGTFRKVQVDVAIVDFIHRLNPGEQIEESLTPEEIGLVRAAVGQVLANYGVSVDAYFEGVSPADAAKVRTDLPLR